MPVINGMVCLMLNSRWQQTVNGQHGDATHEMFPTVTSAYAAVLASLKHRLDVMNMQFC